MKLSKAIELGKEAAQSLKQNKFHDHADAVQMLIDAGRRLLLARSYNNKETLPLLPGEDHALLIDEQDAQQKAKPRQVKVALLVGIDAIERIKAYREQRPLILMMPLKGEILP